MPGSDLNHKRAAALFYSYEENQGPSARRPYSAHKGSLPSWLVTDRDSDHDLPMRELLDLISFPRAPWKPHSSRAAVNKTPHWTVVPQGVRLIVVIVHSLCSGRLFYLGIHKICKCLFQKWPPAKADQSVQGPGC